MNQEQLSDIVEKIVMQELIKNQELITSGLARNLDWDDGWERTISQAVMNAVTVSTRISVQIILGIIASSGIFKISVQEETHPKLTVLQGGAPNPGNTQEQPPLQ